MGEFEQVVYLIKFGELMVVKVGILGITHIRSVDDPHQVPVKRNQDVVFRLQAAVGIIIAPVVLLGGRLDLDLHWPVIHHHNQVK